MAQALLAKHMGKHRIVAETGAGQHGVAAATVCALLGLECIVYMGSEDIRRQSFNVYRMERLGAQVRSVESGSRTLKDAINEAIRDWVTNVETTHYLLGSAVGPHPYPRMVRDFQSVIGNEAREQLMQAEQRLPDYAIACVGGGSNAIGTFPPLPRRRDGGTHRRRGWRNWPRRGAEPRRSSELWTARGVTRLHVLLDAG